MQQEAPSLNLVCIKPVNQNVVWEGDLTALLLLLLPHKKYFVPSMFSVAVWSEHRICVTAAKLTVAYSDDATVRISYLVVCCLMRAMIEVKVTL
jgi:hypothetical protein